jgi:CO dehydrogenase/acetyl-CoA synthase delta subunit
VQWEISTATTLALAGADILVMRHPDAVRAMRAALTSLADA